MKKLIGLLAFLLAGFNPLVMAQPVVKPPFKVSNGFSRGVQTVTGINFVARKVAEGAIARALKPQLKLKPKVRLKLYSAGDLAAGKLRGITISGRHLVLGVPFSQMTLASESPIWLQLKGKPHLRMPVNARFNGVLTEPDLNQMLKQRPTQVKLKLPGLGEQTLLALSPEVHFKPDTLQMKTLLTVPGASVETALPLEVEGQLRPNAERNRLVWHNLRLDSAALQSPQMVAQFVEDQFGKVLSFGSQRISGHPLKVLITESRLENQQWTLQADMRLLPPKP